MKRFYSRLVGRQRINKPVPFKAKIDHLISKLGPNSNTLSDSSEQHLSIKALPVKVRPPLSKEVLNSNSPGASILANSALMVGRQLEMLNVLLGYEQANKYSIKNPQGQDVGFIAEEEQSLTGSILRQLLRRRRAFYADVLDSNGKLAFKISRPITWFLNSEIKITTADENVIGLVKSDWHLWRRRFDLFCG
jgi:hypothetical protein